MRFKLSFVNASGENLVIPINYQYYLHSWFYDILSGADKSYAEWLHTKGFEAERKIYKLFTFSNLSFDRRKYRRVEDKLVIYPEAKGYLTMSFYVRDIAEKFIIGLFSGQQLNVKGNVFPVVELFRLKDPDFKEKMLYHTMTPVKISAFDDKRKTHIYLPPDVPEYERIFTENLKRKAAAVGLSGDADIKFRLKSEYRSKLITIKQGRRDESKNRGFLFVLFYPTSKLFMKKRCVDCNTKLILKN